MQGGKKTIIVWWRTFGIDALRFGQQGELPWATTPVPRSELPWRCRSWSGCPSARHRCGRTHPESKIEMVEQVEHILYIAVTRLRLHHGTWFQVDSCCFAAPCLHVCSARRAKQCAFLVWYLGPRGVDLIKVHSTTTAAKLQTKALLSPPPVHCHG